VQRRSIQNAQTVTFYARVYGVLDPKRALEIAGRPRSLRKPAPKWAGMRQRTPASLDDRRPEPNGASPNWRDAKHWATNRSATRTCQRQPYWYRPGLTSHPLEIRSTVSGLTTRPGQTCVIKASLLSTFGAARTNATRSWNDRLGKAISLPARVTRCCPTSRYRAPTMNVPDQPAGIVSQRERLVSLIDDRFALWYADDRRVSRGAVRLLACADRCHCGLGGVTLFMTAIWHLCKR
jgi:hypothetical protein